MALNKRKILETARKHAQKGAKAKALKEYNRLLQADPRDAKLLLEVGDAYRRWGQAAEAITHYGKVAQQYRQDGFDARAVAVFKQILNLDPKHYAAYVSLAELYQRMGLDAEAVSSLQAAADGYHKEGRKTEALELLRQMAALDPTNTTNRMKVAELLRQEGLESEALSEYRAVAEELERQQARDQLVTVQERILEMSPDDLATLVGLARTFMASSELDRAEPLAVRAVDLSGEPEHFELLIDLHAQMGNDAKLAETTRSLAKVYRERGDDEKARELMQRLPAENVMSDSRLAVDVSEVEVPALGDDELLDDDPFDTLSGMADAGAEPALETGGEAEEISLDLEVGDDPSSAEAPAPEAAAVDLPVPEGDPDQLLAEASVYLRYGKRDQAIASLRGVLAQAPEHRAALEKLGEAYADSDRPEEAVEVWCRAAEQIRAEGDAEAHAVLRDRIAALDPTAAAGLDRVEPAGAADSIPSLEADVGMDVSATEAPADLDLDLDVEVDLDLDQAIEEVADSDSDSESGLEFGGPAESVAPASAGVEATDELEIELDDDSDLFDEALGSDDDGADETAETEPESSGLAEGGLEFGIEDDGPGAAVEEGPSASTVARLGEELEEAEFYIGQEMFDEARAILERILSVAPSHPSALLRLGEIEAAGAGASTGAAASGADVLGADVTARDVDESTARFEDQIGSEDVTESVSAADTEAVSGDRTEDEIAFEMDLDDEPTVPEAPTPSEPPVVAEGPTPSEPSGVAQAPASSPDPGDSFDLREALADVLADDDGPTVDDTPSGVLSTVEEGFESIFSDFKKGVSETLGEGDYDTRYDLGIAYREMGLYEDALGEFRICLASETRRFESLQLMGLCTRDLGRFEESVHHLEHALSLPDLPTERQVGVTFDLALAQEGLGDVERACGSLRRVLELSPDFPGAAEKLRALESGAPAPPEVGEPGTGFESFDDLFDGEDKDEVDEAGDDHVVEAAPVEAFESFDDVLSEAEVVSEEGGAEEGGVPSNPGDSQSGRRGGRKKISFV